MQPKRKLQMTVVKSMSTFEFALCIWLHVALQFPRHVLEPFFVCFARSLMPGFPRFDLQPLVALLPLRDYDDLRLPFCEALCSIALQTDYVTRHCSIQHEMQNNGT
jgi:hypothetical protein